MVQDESVDKCVIVEKRATTEVWFEDVLVCECLNKNGRHIPQMICSFFNALPYWDSIINSNTKTKELAKDLLLNSITGFVDEAKKIGDSQ